MSFAVGVCEVDEGLWHAGEEAGVKDFAAFVREDGHEDGEAFFGDIEENEEGAAEDEVGEEGEDGGEEAVFGFLGV